MRTWQQLTGTPLSETPSAIPIQALALWRWQSPALGAALSPHTCLVCHLRGAAGVTSFAFTQGQDLTCFSERQCQATRPRLRGRTLGHGCSLAVGSPQHTAAAGDSLGRSHGITVPQWSGRGPTQRSGNLLRFSMGVTEHGKAKTEIELYKKCFSEGNQTASDTLK